MAKFLENGDRGREETDKNNLYLSQIHLLFLESIATVKRWWIKKCSYYVYFLWLWVDTRYQPENCKSKKGERDCLLQWICREEVGWGTYFYVMFCHSMRLYGRPRLDSFLFLTFPWNSPALGNIHERQVEEHQPITIGILISFLTPAVFQTRTNHLPPWGVLKPQGNKSLSDSDFSATIVLCLCKPCYL